MSLIGNDKIIKTTENVVGVLLRNYPELATSKGVLKEGGYVSLYSLASEKLKFVSRIGNVVPVEKWKEYVTNSEEKGARLLVTHDKLGHMSSYESRDPNNGKWGGAIVAGNYILSFSGLPEQADEAVMLMVAVKLQLLSIVDAGNIAKRNDNAIFSILVNHMYDE